MSLMQNSGIPRMLSRFENLVTLADRILAPFVSKTFALRHPLTRVDWVVAIPLMLLAVAETIWAINQMGTLIWHATTFNLWFEADTPRVIANWTEATSNQYRSSVHPLTPATLTTTVVAMEKLGIPPMTAVHLLLSAVAAASTGLCLIVLRLLDLPRTVAVAFTAVFLGSAGFIYWAAVPELGSSAMLTIFLGLVLLLASRAHGTVVWVLVGAATMGITVTNWSVGLIAALVRTGLRRTLRIALATIAFVVIASVLQLALFPSAGMLSYKLMDEYRWTQVKAAASNTGVWDPVASVRSLMITTYSATFVKLEQHTDTVVVTNQRAGLFDRTTLGRAVAVGWAALLALGAYGLWSRPDRRSVALGISLILAFQLLLHSVYGDPTFLYAPHFLPILIVIAGSSWFTRARWAVVVVAAFVVIAGFVDNSQQFRVAINLAETVIDDGGNPIHPSYPPGGALLP